MATVLSLVPAPLPAVAAAERLTCGLMDICWRLGEARGGSPKRVVHVRALIQHHGFPPPFPRRAHRAAPGDPLLVGAAAVHPAARWDRRAVDAWFDDGLPPAAREAAARAERDAAADLLDARAAAIGGL